MDLEKFKKDIENPIFNSLDAVFSRAELTQEEVSIYLKYRKICEYWLLRSKVNLSHNPWSNHPNFIKQLARLLINLNHKNVIGPKDKLVKELFSDKKIHRFKEIKGGGIRSTIYSNKIPNTFFELDIMSFFLSHDFKVELPKQNIVGKKIPEFKILKNNISINIEAKKMDQDKILDSIFGDRMVEGIDYKIPQVEQERGYKRIRDQFARCYEKAIMKYNDIPDDEFYIIFISAGDLGFLGQPTLEYIKSIPESWDRDYSNLIGLVLPSRDKTYFLINNECDFLPVTLIHDAGIEQYHAYIPEIISE